MVKIKNLAFFLSFIVLLSQAHAGREIDHLGESLAFTAMTPKTIPKEMVKDFIEALEKKNVVSSMPEDVLQDEKNQLAAVSIYESLVKSYLGLEEQDDIADFSSNNYSNLQKLVFLKCYTIILIANKISNI